MDRQTKVMIVGGATVLGFVFSLINTGYRHCKHDPNDWIFGDLLMLITAGIGIQLVNMQNKALKICVWTYFVVASVFSVFWNIWGLYVIFKAYFGNHACMSAINFFLAFVLCCIIGYFYYLVGRRLFFTNGGPETFVKRLVRFIQEDIRSVDQVQTPQEFHNDQHIDDERLLEDVRHVGVTESMVRQQEQNHGGLYQQNAPSGPDPMALLSNFKGSQELNKSANFAVSDCAYCHKEAQTFEELLTRSCGHKFHARCFQSCQQEDLACPGCTAAQSQQTQLPK